MSREQAPALARVFGVAAEAIAQVMHGHTPDVILTRTDAALRPAVRDLTQTTLRNYGYGDALLARLLDRPLKDRLVHALLLIALTRLEARPAEAHTAVDQAVEAARRLPGGRFANLVNAVLRNFLRRREALLAGLEEDPVVRWRHPGWWLDSLRTAYPDDWMDVAAAGNSHPPMCLRVNRRRLAGVDFLQRLAHADIAARPVGDTALLLEKPLPVERLPGFAQGECSVQDWGAQQAASLLDVQDGLRVLDACAAPGGKSAHLLEQADLQLTSLELDAGRARRIGENFARLGLTATIKTGDALRPQDWWDGRYFDRILADVPCSASGVVRRHPDIKWLRRAGDVAGFAQTQAGILDALWPLLAPGGKMLYCTCSVFPAENGAQMRAFTARHADARRLPTGGASDELQLLPTADHDGFYYALLEKTP